MTPSETIQYQDSFHEAVGALNKYQRNNLSLFLTKGSINSKDSTIDDIMNNISVGSLISKNNPDIEKLAKDIKRTVDKLRKLTDAVHQPIPNKIKDSMLSLWDYYGKTQ